MSFADELTPEATALIDEFGAAVTYTPVVSGTYNPATSEAVVSGDPIPLKALIEDTTIGVDNGNGGLVRVPAKRLTLAGGVVDFKPEHIFTIGGRAYKVARTRSYGVAENVIVWQVMVVPK